jgi:hypothetical protein
VKEFRKRFADAHEKKRYAGRSVEAGREYVDAYVEYVHFVERIHDLVLEGAPHPTKKPEVLVSHDARMFMSRTLSREPARR